MKFAKKFAILFVIAILVSVTLLYFLWDNYDVRKNDLILQGQRNLQSQYLSIINSQRTIAHIYYEEAIDIPSIVNYLQQAYNLDAFAKRELRNDMYKEFNPIYESLRDKDFKYLQFYLADGESFLRMHEPDKFGDNLIKDRYSIRLVNERMEYIEGFELANDYNGYRYVFPLFDNGNYVGGVEFGFSINTLRHKLDSIFSMTYNFIIHRKLLVKKVDIGESIDYFFGAMGYDYVYERDSEEIKRVYTVPVKTTAMIDWKIKDKLPELLDSHEAFSLLSKVSSLNYITYFVPINCVTEQHLGYLTAYAIDNSIYLLKDGLYVQYIVVFSLILIILFFVYYMNEGQRQLMDKNEELDNITHTIGEGLLVIKKNKHIMFFNTAAERITGFLAEEVLGKLYTRTLKFVNEETEKPSHDFINEVISKKKIKIITSEMAMVHKNGNIMPMAVNAAPLRNKNNEVIGCIVVFRDVTKEREIDKAKTEFVSLASHQLQTPLSAVNWHTEMLLDPRVGDLNKKQKEFLHAIYEGNKRMIKLVNSLLNVSRIDMGTLAIKPELTNLSKMIDSILKELLFRVDIKELEIVKDYGKMPKIKVDPQLMRIVLQNIISNAIKYSKEEGKIIISMTKDKKHAIIAIQDHGYGIPKEQQPKIFSKLFRADNVKTRKVEGTGLGLYVAKAVIHAFGGKIWFKSEENKGTTFFISIHLKGVKEKSGTRTLESNI
ncbi:MAG: ATP-binding protein [bacterium]